jgi:hypothetical protein
VRSIWTKFTGSAPVWRTRARFLASPIELMFEISAPPTLGSMPPGFCL